MKNLLWFLGAWTRPVAVAGLMAFGGPGSAAVLFEDSFEGGTLSPAWDSRLCCQWVEDGWMHTQDQDGWPRESLATVHDGDRSWRNFKVSMQAQFVDIGFVDNFGLHFRADNFETSSDGRQGLAYQLDIVGPRGWDDGGNHVVLIRSGFDGGAPQDILLGDVHMVVPTSEMLIEATLIGGHIQIWIDHAKIFDVVDPHPLAGGGVGIHAIWESEARFDNVRVTSIPEPSTAWTAGLGLAALAGMARWSRRRSGR